MEAPLKLRHLQHLVLLADELHFARAAERAFLSQSAFSRSIVGLEEEAGMRLFDRGPHFVRPTPAGQQVIERARRLLSSSQDLAREVAMLRSGDLGNIAVGAGPFSGITLMPGALAELRRMHPGVQIRLAISDAWSLLQQLREETLDFFVAEITEVVSSDAWAVQPLGRLTGAFFCRSEHPLAGKDSVGVAELASASFVSVHLPARLRSALGKLIAPDKRGELAIAVECESVAVLRALVFASDVIMLASDGAMQTDVAAGTIQRLRIRELDGPGGETAFATDFGMVHLRDRTPTTASLRLMALVRAQALNSFASARR